MRSSPAAVALAHPHLPGEQQRLGAACAFGEAALDEQLIEADRRGDPAHALIVAHATARAHRTCIGRLSTRRRHRWRPRVGGLPPLGRAARPRRRDPSGRERLARPAPASPSASRRSTRRRSATEPWSTNRSAGMPMIRTGRLAEAPGRPSRASSSASRTADPNPPVTTLSSNVTTSRLPRAWSRISSAVERLREPGVDDADRPALAPRARRRPRRARMTIGPKPTNRTSSPSRSTSPLADRDRPSARPRGSPKPGVARVVERERVVLGERRPERASAAPARPSGWR